MSAARRVSAADTLPVGAPEPVAPGDHYFRARDVQARVGLSRTTIWRLVRVGQFPAPRRLSANAIGWLASEVEAWIASRVPTTGARARLGSPPAQEGWQ